MKKRILCFGDSNTWGYHAPEAERFDEETRWTWLLADMLGSDYVVIEEGQNGRTTVWDDPIENRLAGLTYLWPCMESHAPFDLIIIMLGTNDTKTYFSSSAQNIADGAGRLVETALRCPYGRDKKPPRVLLAAPIAIAEDNAFPYLFGPQAAKKTQEFPLVFEETAKKWGCDFFDAAAFAAPGTADGVHLNEEGHKKLAKAFYDKIMEMGI